MSDRAKEYVVVMLKRTRVAFCLLFSLALVVQFGSLTLLGYGTGTVTPGLPNLEVDIDVGSIHFRGELAEFYILVSHAGKRVDAQVSASLYFGGALIADLTT